MDAIHIYKTKMNIKHDEYDTEKGDIVDDLLGDYVRIFVYDDEKEENDG